MKDIQITLDDFLDKNNKKYQIQVIAPTTTYGTMCSFDSQFDFDIVFDEYDKVAEWEFNVVINGEIVASFSSIEETREHIENNLI